MSDELSAVGAVGQMAANLGENMAVWKDHWWANEQVELLENLWVEKMVDWKESLMESVRAESTVDILAVVMAQLTVDVKACHLELHSAVWKE